MSLIREAAKKEFRPTNVGVQEFAESSDYCNKPLYPLQRVLLKLIFLEEMEGWEEDLLTFMINGGRNREILVSPRLRERRDWCRERNYEHFSEIDLVGGRRSSKGHITGLAGAYKLWKTREIPDPAAFFGMDIDKQIEFSCIAASFEQAKTRQFADFYSAVNRCKALQPYISKRQEEVITLHADTDIVLINEMKRNKVKINKDFAKFRMLPLAANADTLRGSASIFTVFDEMAFMMPGESRSSASECYVAAEPSLAQFGHYALVFCNSSPYSRIGQFYTQFELAMRDQDHAEPWYPMRFAFQFPSWALYDMWWKDPERRWRGAIMVSPDWPDQLDSEVEESKLDDKSLAMRTAERLKEKGSPDTYRVEYRAQWAEVLDAYLLPEKVDAAFSGIKPDNTPCMRTSGGTYQYTYMAHCFSGDTEIMTDTGLITLADAAGSQVRVLSATEWRTAEIRSFGVQPLLSVTLSRNGVQKTVRATPDHVWLLGDKNRASGQPTLTRDLQPGDRLSTTKAHKRVRKLSPFGVAHGFAYGDGSRTEAHGTRVYFHPGKDEPIMSFFRDCTIRLEQRPDGLRRFVASDCPKFFKALPSLAEIPSYLYGWLAGYFAADGTISTGGRCSISSASRESLEFVRDVCALLGIFTWGITSHERVGYGSEKTPLYRVQLSRHDLSSEFFVLPHHRARFDKQSESKPALWRQCWVVEGVEDRNEQEEVFCAVVPDTHTFALADNIHVHNCDPSSTTAGFGFALGHVEEFPDETGIFPDGVARHVVFDLVKRWNPKNFPGEVINYIAVREELTMHANLYRPVAMTFDQYNSAGLMQELREETRKLGIQNLRISEVTATQKVNWNRWEAFKTALYLGLVHVPPDCIEMERDGEFDHSEYAKQELKFLQEIQTGQTKRVDKQELGPIQTKDIADCIAEVTVKFLGSYIGDFMQKNFEAATLAAGAEGGYPIGGRQSGGPVGGQGHSGSLFDSFYNTRSKFQTNAARGIDPRRRRR